MEASRLVTQLIQQHEPERIHSYQGNWLNDRAVIDVAKSMDLPHGTYGEVSPGEYWHWDRDPYEMKSWQDLDVWRQWCKAVEAISFDDRQTLINHLIQESSSPRINPFSTYGQASTKFTVPACEYIVFFTANSNDERFGLDSSWEPFWPDQVSFAVQLGAALADRGRHLVVRVHPNTSSKPACEQRPWTQLVKQAELGVVRGLSVVPAKSSQDSYQLALGALGNVTWGSNISVELAARNLKVVNVAPAAFDSLGAVPVAKSLESLMALIEAPSSGEAQRERAAAWLWYMRARWTTPFQYVNVIEDASGLGQPFFLGHRIAAPMAIERLSRPWSRARASRLLSPLMCRRYQIDP